MTSHSKKINIGIIGGAGYGGSELLRFLVFHPKVHIRFVTSRKHAGLDVTSVYRFLSGRTDLKFIKPDVNKLPQDTECVFFATPHGVSMTLVPQIIKRMPEARIVDLSGDFRLKNPDIYTQHYNNTMHKSPKLLSDFVYGLPEMNRNEIKKAKYVANPGCFATGIIFAIYPLFQAGAVKREVAVVAVTGSSGSGELPKEVTHHPVRAKNFKSYKILEHQHTPEIEQFFKERFGGLDFEIGFVPQSGTFVRGIYTTATVYNEEINADEVRKAFKTLFEKEKFVRIVPSSPEITMVYGSNYVEVSYVYRKNFIVTMSAIDNLVRGASGQAIQNMNIMFGFKEDEGLEFPGMRP
jgi:N-acetyl-gamma-glutamyl-phosphate/LysW-gamma-L-alpha-aminoadipyl-6-phosphate reductase